MIHYQVYKNQNTTKWVTFVHGAGGSSSIWFKQIRAFKKMFNVLLLDLRGHGNSKPKQSMLLIKNTPSISLLMI